MAPHRGRCGRRRKWIFIGMESIDTDNLAAVNKSFNKPENYQEILDRLAERGIYAITSFIFGMDGDRASVADRTVDKIETWAPGLPVYGLLTPYPATPLYDRLAAQGRLTRPLHWLDFRPFRMAFTPNEITIDQAEREVRRAWKRSYSARAITRALRKIAHRPFHERAILLSARLAFRGIYFPQIRKWHWVVLLGCNAPSILRLFIEGVTLKYRPPLGLTPPRNQQLPSVDG
jgi:radical SAM superfamily enzyme YgiQ (UPF0313 family)